MPQRRTAAEPLSLTPIDPHDVDEGALEPAALEPRRGQDSLRPHSRWVYGIAAAVTTVVLVGGVAAAARYYSGRSEESPTAIPVGASENEGDTELWCEAEWLFLEELPPQGDGDSPAD